MHMSRVRRTEKTITTNTCAPFSYINYTHATLYYMSIEVYSFTSMYVNQMFNKIGAAVV